MKSLIVETLRVWREAERMVDRLPAQSAERELVELLSVQLSAIHRRLTSRQGVSEEVLSYSSRALESARQILRRAAESPPGLRSESGRHNDRPTPVGA